MVRAPKEKRNRAWVNVPNRLGACPSRTERACRHSTTASTRAASFDDLVGAAEDRLGNRQPERLCGLQVHGKFVVRGLLDRQIARRRASEDLGDEVRCAAPQLVRLGP